MTTRGFRLLPPREHPPREMTEEERGEELASLLVLAMHLPRHQSPELTYPPFRSRRERSTGSCKDLALFKAFFDRPKDWFDLGEMFEARSIELEEMTDLIAGLLEPDDDRIARLQTAYDDGERTRLRREAGGTAAS